MLMQCPLCDLIATGGTAVIILHQTDFICHPSCFFSLKMSSEDHTRVLLLEEQVKSLSDELMQCQVCMKARYTGTVRLAKVLIQVYDTVATAPHRCFCY